MAIFKPQKLSWEDVDGGFGEQIMEQIEEFIISHCYEPEEYEDDENLINELVFFAENWDNLIKKWEHDDGRIKICIVISIIYGLFDSSWVRDKLMENLEKSMTKRQIIELYSSVSGLMFQYFQLSERVCKHEINHT